MEFRKREIGLIFFKEDARVKTPRVGFRPAFLGQYQGSVRLILTFGGRVKEILFFDFLEESA